MNRQLALGLVVLLVALTGPLAYVPWVTWSRLDSSSGFARSETVPPRRWDWCWNKGDDIREFADPSTPRAQRRTPPLLIEDRVEWPLVAVEQALILLLGGGLLTWVVRRERRRRVGARA